MRRLPLLLTFFLLASCLPASPPQSASAGRMTVAGVLTGFTILRGEVEMAGDLLVPAGSTLVLEAGTTVHVQPSESTKIDPEYLSSMTELLVRGTLRIEGTSAAPVRFVPAGSPAEAVWWGGILLDGATDTVIEHAELSGAETGILCLRSSPRLQENLLRGCRYGIIAQEKSAPKIRGNRIEEGEGGVFCWRGSNPRLEENRLAGNQEEGLFIDAGSRPVLGRNEIVGNAVGVALYDRGLDLQPLHLSANGEEILWLGGAEN